MNQYFAGLDIGGSTIKCMLIDGPGRIVGPLIEVASHVKEGYQRTFEQLILALEELSSQAGVTTDEIAGIGLDVPAPCSHGVVWSRANLADDWVGTEIRGQFSARIHKPVFMTNDCNAAAFGEWMYRGNQDVGLLYVAPGTGLGGGLVLPGGHLYEGTNGLALEVGDLSVPRTEHGEFPVDGRGRQGCLEGWVSLMALRRQLASALQQPEHSAHPLALSDAPIADKAFSLRNYAEQGDALALSIFALQANVLGHGLGDLASIVDPGLIAIGGGLSETSFRDWFLAEVRKGFAERAWPAYRQSPIPPHAVTTHIEWACGGDSSAAFGSAQKARQMFS